MENLLISTRQPTLLKDIESKYNIKVVFNNTLVAETCDFIYVCCLPLQLDSVMADIKKVLQTKQRSPILVSILAETTAAKIAQSIGKKKSGELYKEIITTKVHYKKLKAALSKEAGENVARQKIAESLGKMYKKISITMSGAAGKEVDIRLDTPSSVSSRDGRVAEDEAAKIIREFIIHEAAEGLTFKRGEELIAMTNAYNALFQGLGYGKILEIIMGETYEGMLPEQLLEYFLRH